MNVGHSRWAAQSIAARIGDRGYSNWRRARRFVVGSGLLVAIGAAGAFPSCSLMLNWGEDGLPCDGDKKCNQGFSCLVNKCVAEGSLPVEETCSDPVQCEGFPSFTCGTDPFTCRKKCGAYYQATSDCNKSGEYCRPEVSREDGSQWTGTCFASECARDRDCPTGLTCVQISASAGACLAGCSYSFSTGNYTDTCGSTAEESNYCQPVGMRGAQKLACFQNIGAAGNPPNDDPTKCNVCTAMDGPCQPGAACVNGCCRSYCDSAQAGPCNSTAGFVCCPITNTVGGPVLFSVCLDDCV